MLNNLYNKLLDTSIYFSFDKSGFNRHQKNFKKLKTTHIKGRTFLITGGTSGIGASLAKRLLKNGAYVIVTGRSKKRYIENFKNYIDKEEFHLNFIENDLCDFKSIIKLSKEIRKINVLVCNAGAMPDELQIIEDKYNSIFASQVVGHFLLIKSLIHFQRFSDKPAIHFNSSGGMYPVKLSTKDLKYENKKYDKANAYAVAKRAQVILSEELAKRYPHIMFSSSHPGWVVTPGLEESLKGFVKFTRNRLRSAAEGADTLFFLCAKAHELESAKFWFDRKKRSTYLIPGTKESEQDRRDLMKLLEDQYNCL